MILKLSMPGTLIILKMYMLWKLMSITAINMELRKLTNITRSFLPVSTDAKNSASTNILLPHQILS